MKLLFEYGWILIAVILFVIYLWTIYQKSGWGAVLTDLRIKAYALMLLAEKEYIKSQGAEKFQFVLCTIYGMLPKSLKIFLTKDALAKIIQRWYEQAKDILDDGTINDSN